MKEKARCFALTVKTGAGGEAENVHWRGDGITIKAGINSSAFIVSAERGRIPSFLNCFEKRISG